MDSSKRKKNHKDSLMSNETFIKTIEELKNDIVIVEGKKDTLALKRLGVENVIAINGMPLFEFVSKRLKGHKEVVILTDFDKEGRNLHSKLKIMLQRYGIKTIERLRRKMMRFKKTRIEDFNKV